MNSNINVCTYPINDPRFGRALNRIYLMAEEIDSTDKLYMNYTFDGLKVKEWIGVSIYEEVLPGKLKGNYEYGMFLYTDYFGQEDEDLVKLKLKDMFKGKRPK